MYTEVYDSLLPSENPPSVAIGYKIHERPTDKEVFFTGSIPADEFLQKGSPVVPIGMLVAVKDLAPGSYRLIFMAIDAALGHGSRHDQRGEPRLAPRGRSQVSDRHATQRVAQVGAVVAGAEGLEGDQGWSRGEAVPRPGWRRNVHPLPVS